MLLYQILAQLIGCAGLKGPDSRGESQACELLYGSSLTASTQLRPSAPIQASVLVVVVNQVCFMGELKMCDAVPGGRSELGLITVA